MAKRLYVGNLSSTVNESDIQSLLTKYGKVEDVLIKEKKNELDFSVKRFAFVSIHLTSEALPQCIRELTNHYWKGSDINVQLAKESFLDKLQKERNELKKQLSSDFKQTSNHKRLSSLSHTLEMRKNEANLVKMSLSKFGKQNSKLVFNVDNQESVSNNIDKVPVKKLTLFDSDNKNCEEESDQNFNIKSISENEKYIELQSRFAHDPRFKIDSRFVEDESEKIVENESAQDFKSLKEVENTIGRPIKKTFETKKSIFIPRYDPSKPESSKYLIKKPVFDQKKSSPTLKVESPPKVDIEKVSKDRFYEVDESLKTIVQQKESDFSLLRLFGRDNQEEEEEAKHCDDMNLKVANEKVKIKAKALEVVKKVSKSKFSKLKFDKFFFSSSDPRLEENTFFKPNLIQTHLDSWKRRRIQMASVSLIS